MNLICPHCQKLVSVPESSAGQTTNCPECKGPFTVPKPIPPASPPSPPSPSSPPGPAPFSMAPASAPTAPYSAPLAAAHGTPDPLGDFEDAGSQPPGLPSQSTPPPTGDYRRRWALTLQPRIIRWIAPACFVLIFFLFFFPWVGMYEGSHTVVRQLGAGVAFGLYDGEKGADTLPKEDRPGVGPFTLLYFLVILGSVFVAGVLVVLAVAPQVIPPHLVQLITPWRSLAVAGIALLALLFLLPQIVFSLPLESKVLDAADKDYEAAIKAAKDGEKPEAKLKAEREYGVIKNALQRRIYFRLVMLLNLIAVLGALADLWLEKRRGQPLPRAVIEW